MELISFEIAGQAFCVDVRSVREIRGWSATTPVPHAPDYMMGVINLRGAVMPVIDLRARLGLGRTEPSDRHVIVVMHNDGFTAGLLVDAVQETFVVDDAAMQRPPHLHTAGERFVDAIFPLEGRLLSRLAVEVLLPRELEAA